MGMKLQDIETELVAVRAELKNIEENPDSNEDDEGAVVDTLLSRHDELEGLAKPLRERMKRLGAVRYAAQDPTNGESAGDDEEDDGADGGSAIRTGITVHSRGRRNPYENLQAVRNRTVNRGELRGRALDAIELASRSGDLLHDYAENATRLVQDNPMIGRHVLLTGSDEYRESFREYLEDPEGNAQRAALSLTLANGGYLLPFVLDPTIVLTNAASANPYRRISNVKQTTSNTWNGVTSAGVTAAWLAEGTAAADNTPTVGNIQITPLKAAAWVFGSFEVLADTDFGSQLPTLLQDARDRLEENAFAVGTGTAQPKGIVTAATTTVATVTTGAYVVADVYALHAALPPRFRNSSQAAFVGNVAQINRTRQLDTAGGASFWTNLGKDAPEQLLGKGIYESSSMTNALTTTSKIMVFGDFGQYYIVDRIGVSVIYEPMITGTGASANLPTGQSGWFMFWRVGADAAVPGAFRTLLT